VANIRQSRPDLGLGLLSSEYGSCSALGFHMKVLKTFQGVASSISRGEWGFEPQTLQLDSTVDFRGSRCS